MFSSKPYDIQYMKSRLETKNPLNLTFDFEKKPLTEHTKLTNCQAVCIFVNDICNRKVIENLSKAGVKLVALRCAGFNNVDLKAAKDYRIKISRVPSYSPHSVAEFGVASMLALNRKICVAHQRIKNHNFTIDNLIGFDVYGKTVGILGTGSIGSCAVSIYNGFQCKVFGYDIKQNKELCRQFNFKYRSLDEILTKSDILSVHLPLNESTKYILDKSAFEKMKRNAILINCGRGALINSKDLIQAIKSQRIKGACLDVYENESEYFYNDHSDIMIDDDVLSRLISCPNVLLTSHQAFLTDEALGEISESTISSIEQLANNQLLTNEVL